MFPHYVPSAAAGIIVLLIVMLVAKDTESHSSGFYSGLSDSVGMMGRSVGLSQLN